MTPMLFVAVSFPSSMTYDTPPSRWFPAFRSELCLHTTRCGERSAAEFAFRRLVQFRLRIGGCVCTILGRLNEALDAWLRATAEAQGVSCGLAIRKQLEQAKTKAPSKSFIRFASAVAGARGLSTRKGFSRGVKASRTRGSWSRSAIGGPEIGSHRPVPERKQ